MIAMDVRAAHLIRRSRSLRRGSLALEAKLGIFVITILVFTFGFIVYRKMDRHQQLASANIRPPGAAADSAADLRNAPTLDNGSGDSAVPDAASVLGPGRTDSGSMTATANETVLTEWSGNRTATRDTSATAGEDAFASLDEFPSTADSSTEPTRFRGDPFSGGQQDHAASVPELTEPDNGIAAAPNAFGSGDRSPSDLPELSFDDPEVADSDPPARDDSLDPAPSGHLMEFDSAPVANHDYGAAASGTADDGLPSAPWESDSSAFADVSATPASELGNNLALSEPAFGGSTEQSPAPNPESSPESALSAPGSSGEPPWAAASVRIPENAADDAAVAPQASDSVADSHRADSHPETIRLGDEPPLFTDANPDQAGDTIFPATDESPAEPLPAADSDDWTSATASHSPGPATPTSRTGSAGSLTAANGHDVPPLRVGAPDDEPMLLAMLDPPADPPGSDPGAPDWPPADASAAGSADSSTDGASEQPASDPRSGRPSGTESAQPRTSVAEPSMAFPEIAPAGNPQRSVSGGSAAEWPGAGSGAGSGSGSSTVDLRETSRTAAGSQPSANRGTGQFSVAAFRYQNDSREAPPTGETYSVVTVRDGENYWSISRRVYGTSRYFSALALFNQHRIPDPKAMRPGMKVLVPPEETLEERYPQLFRDQRPRQVLPAAFLTLDDGSPAYRVGNAETLSEIAERLLGRSSRWIEIYRMNQHILKDPNKLKPGTILSLPDDAVEVHVTP